VDLDHEALPAQGADAVADQRAEEGRALHRPLDRVVPSILHDPNPLGPHGEADPLPGGSRDTERQGLPARLGAKPRGRLVVAQSREFEDVAPAHELGGKAAARIKVDLIGGAELLQFSQVEDGDAVRGG